ncbi:AarF/ABC1/UbiB kinase family protein [Asinibacterium sp. OR53]|uniref:ABC1 kinase family protein n=1 Tax=Asinibacterium sp. OR53 TaxID=925409 RepID=UPI00047C2697|nr:AarF/UbiB family protein [Asinibacterium sp. OR53]
MKTLDKIPKRKIERVGNLLKAGAKVGINYLQYYGSRISLEDEEIAKEQLHKNNALDIYDSLKTLKGSALKIAQMLSMEKNIMPQAYVETFSLSQFSVPPLSGALIKKTFRKYFGKNPEALFDTFSVEAINAASIGQVHQAEKNGRRLAVKIQYPGVRESISSDLAIVKPIAMKMFHIKKEGSAKYFEEVEQKLLEETDYLLELERSKQFAHDCRELPGLRFPGYYPEYSCDKVLTMDWMEGVHFSEFVQRTNNEPECLHALGQTLWDFYMYQMHVLKRLHADPHPGNFLVSATHELIVIDFGCIKEIPPEFYIPYFELAISSNLNNPRFFEEKLYELEILLPSDTNEEKTFFTTLFHDMLTLFTRPFNEEFFDFSDERFFEAIAVMGQRYASMSQVRSMNTNRGSKHFIYLNRTFFGLYNMMHALRPGRITIRNYERLNVPASQ